MYQILAYIKFILKSSNQHGIHSPFVYDLITKCFYDKTKYTAYSKLKKYRQSLLNSKEKLQITDFGEGSKRLSKKERRISDMAKMAGSSKKDGQFIFRLSQYFQFKTTLELGTSLGMGTQAFALAHPENNITTIEGCPNTSRFALQQFQRLGLKNITAINSDFGSAISTLKNANFDCIFFDGHHNKTATLNYFNRLILKAHNNSVFIFDDIYWSKEMTEAWQQISKDNRVTVSIDTFYFGLVFFRKEQPKQHFRIRI